MRDSTLYIGALASNNVNNIVNDAGKYDEYKEKVKDLTEEIQTRKDTFEKMAEPLVYVCDCYQKFNVVTGMPKSNFGDSFGYDMQKDISSHMTDFYAGKVSRDELNSYFEECCTSMRTYRTSQHQTSGTNEADNTQIVSEMYEVFAKENARAASQANYQEGKALNEKYYSDSHSDWTYYNSDYYYQCNETNAALRESVKQMTEKWDLDEIDCDKIEANSSLTLDGGFDFNSTWNFEFRNQAGRSSLAKESAIPPENFKMFFKEQVTSFTEDNKFNGNLKITIGENNYDLKVPFQTLRTGSEGEICNVWDLMEDYYPKSEDTSKVKNFLGNMSVFTRWYAYETRINDIFGDYEVSNNPDHVMIRTKWGKTDVATVKKNTQVRYQGGVKSPVLAELKKKDEVTVVESEQNWKKVRTADGVIGYVKNKTLKNEEKKNITRKFEEQDYSNITKDYTINMAWHNVTNQDANNAVAQRIAQTKGLTTLAPTWIHVADTNGNISSIASADYVSYAHKQNVEVWMTVRDFDGGISSEKESYELLSYTSRRETLITQLIAEALRVGVDGINVDFEKISDKCGEHYIEFIRELSVKCRQNGLVLSVDNYVPKSFNTQYDRKEQGIVADYVVIMGYDEYYAGSPEAGPVSSYNYVKEGITETLKEVPAEKVISGIPFFTRLWKETPKTEEELKSDKGTDAEQYSTTVESDAYGMDNAQAIVKQAGVDTTWDKKAGQNYATWEADGSKYEIWMEDSKSIEAKLKLMKKYKLAGTAEWSLGQESSDIWNLIQKYVN